MAAGELFILLGVTVLSSIKLEESAVNGGDLSLKELFFKSTKNFRVAKKQLSS